MNIEDDKSIALSTQQNIIKEINKAVEQYSIKKHPAEHRDHLGASIIGENCHRKLWYSFRWCKLEQFEGRMLRLFDRGQKEEKKFIQILRSIGFTIFEIDPETKKQFRITGIEGHFGGSADAIAIVDWIPNEQILLEFKTHNTKSFCNLVAKKLGVAKPQHYIQMCMYAKALKIKYGLYCAVNKNDDDLYFELVELDWNMATLAENKARNIIEAQIPPQRISNQPSYWKCKDCNFQEICHFGVISDKNCRSCKMSKPIENAKWFCNKFNNVIPSDFIPKGCDHWDDINEHD